MERGCFGERMVPPYIRQHLSQLLGTLMVALQERRWGNLVPLFQGILTFQDDNKVPEISMLSS